MATACLVVDLTPRVTHGVAIDDGELADSGRRGRRARLHVADNLVRDAAQEQVTPLGADVSCREADLRGQLTLYRRRVLVDALREGVASRVGADVGRPRVWVGR